MRSAAGGQQSDSPSPYSVPNVLARANARKVTGPYRWLDEIDFTVRQPLGQVLLVRSTGNTRYF